MGLHFQRGSQHHWCLIQVSVRGRRCPFCLQLSSDLKAPHDLHPRHGTPSPPRTPASWLHLPPLLSLTPLGIQEFLLFLNLYLLPEGLYTCCSLYYECSSPTNRYSSLPCLQGSAHCHCIRRASLNALYRRHSSSPAPTLLHFPFQRPPPAVRAYNYLLHLLPSASFP